ncbi:hypothetical protein [Reyranella sp.]|jgi:hypothetical protein|uniref:hypothetical protein n=1 Tax=Reyranella sp. TaxID=1929291 RepID=UPI003D0F781C
MHSARQARAIATMLLGVAIAVATVIAGRILIFEYFHGSAATVRDLMHRLF